MSIIIFAIIFRFRKSITIETIMLILKIGFIYFRSTLYFTYTRVSKGHLMFLLDTPFSPEQLSYSPEQDSNPQMSRLQSVAVARCATTPLSVFNDYFKIINFEHLIMFIYTYIKIYIFKICGIKKSRHIICTVVCTPNRTIVGSILFRGNYYIYIVFMPSSTI